MTERSGSRSLFISTFFACVLTSVMGTQGVFAGVFLITLPDREALLNPDWPDEASTHDAAFAEPAPPVVTLAPEMSAIMLPVAIDPDTQVTSTLPNAIELLDHIKCDCADACITAWNQFVMDTILRDPIAAVVASVSSAAQAPEQPLAPAEPVAASADFSSGLSKPEKLSPIPPAVLFRPLLRRSVLALEDAAESLKLLAKELTALEEPSSTDAPAASDTEGPTPSETDSASLPQDPAADSFFDF